MKEQWNRLIAKMRKAEGWDITVASNTVTIIFYIPLLEGNVTATFTYDQLEEAQAYYEGYTD